MNTWTDSGMSEAGLVGAMLALGLDSAPVVGAAPTGGPRLPARLAARSARSTGHGRFPAPERSDQRVPSSYPPPPMPEPKLASDDLSGWTDGFLAGGSPFAAPPSWDEPAAAVHDRSAPQPAELTSMLDCLLDPDPARRAEAPAAPERVVSTPLAAAAASALDDGPLDVAELEPAQLDFEFAPLDRDNLEPALLEPASPSADGPAEEPSLAELTGLDRPGLGPVVLGPLGLESTDLDASVFTGPPASPPPAQPAVAVESGQSETGSSRSPGAEPAGSGPAAAGPAGSGSDSRAAVWTEPAGSGPDRAEPVPAGVPGAARAGSRAAVGADPVADDAVAPGAGRRRAAVGSRRVEESPLSSLDDSPLFSSLSPRRY